MQWLETPVKYASSELATTATERNVIGVVADRAEVYCRDCAVKLDVMAVGEISPDTKYFSDAVCDNCGKALLDGRKSQTDMPTGRGHVGLEENTDLDQLAP